MLLEHACVSYRAIPGQHFPRLSAHLHQFQISGLLPGENLRHPLQVGCYCRPPNKLTVAFVIYDWWCSHLLSNGNPEFNIKAVYRDGSAFRRRGEQVSTTLSCGSGQDVLNPSGDSAPSTLQIGTLQCVYAPPSISISMAESHDVETKRYFDNKIRT
ncbi:hypothetical protein K443DRAFT_293241 [Laccaria amethystina LaAM-08-1]|uniref:Uncharacterized protein n=1 Tax=Laccaria amethystina LaAM-08-1 TaxID=1095629 RepID=A0A0C9XJ65_9AGAR|nr:hypothetical protein K443DRAFT_293241 [Laccaria amethystina LaAM-08-1]